MARIKLKHYAVRKGKHGYWLPTPKMVAAGFKAIPCGHDGPEAWKIAKEWEDRWQAYRRGNTGTFRRHPKNSIGDAFERFRLSGTWKAKKPRTREDWERGWRYINPVFGDQLAHSITFEHLDAWYHKIKAAHGVSEAFRAMKIWRALYRVMASMSLAIDGQDPSLSIRRETPKPRDEVWTEGETVRFVKGAWRAGYRGLACIVSAAWDTGFAPVDVRTLTPNDAFEAGNEWGFAVDRDKTGVPVYGTLCTRTRRLILAYLDELGAAILPEAPLFRSRGFSPGLKGGRPRVGVPYTRRALGDDFADVRRMIFGESETRTLMDMRRSGAREANAGEVTMTSLAAKMGNSIDTSKALQKTYMPVNLAAVRAADEARRKGRRALAEERNQPKKLKLGG